MPPANFFDEEDEWYHRDRYVSGARHVRPPRARDDGYGRRSDLQVPEARTYTTELHRTRSQGHAPAPNVTIYNTTRMDNESSPNVRTDQRSPAPSPLLSPRGRPLRVTDEYTLEDELAELRLEVARQRRSRSRSAHHHHDDSADHGHAHHNHDYDRWQLQMANERLKEAEEKIQQEKREELLKKRFELKYLKEKADREEEEAKLKAEEDRLKKEWQLKMEQEERKKLERAKQAEEERKRIIAENTLRLEEGERRAKAERQAAVDAFNKKKAEEERKAQEERQAAVDAFNKKKAEDERRAQEERDRVIADYERKKVEDAVKAKRQRDELLLQIKIEAEKKRQEEQEEYERFMAKQEKIQREEKARKEKEEKELEEQMRKRLAQFGFQENQIQAMIKPEEAAKLQQGMTPLNPMRLHHQPTYVKVHKDHLSIDTLIYYDIPYEIDRSDPDHIIVLREMDQRETEILFEHTRRLRNRGSARLLIEERNDRGKPEYAWVRRRNKSVSRSPSRRRTSPKRVVGIKEMFY